jgi:hypothetical protein
MQAIGANTAGQIGSVMAGGVVLALLAWLSVFIDALWNEN